MVVSLKVTAKAVDKVEATSHDVTMTAKLEIAGTQSKRTLIDNLYGWRL